MPSLFDYIEIEIPCNQCSHITKKAIGWIKNKQKFSCVCGNIINLKSEQFETRIIEAENSINRLKNSFKKIKI